MGTDSRKEEDESALTSTGLLMEGLSEFGWRFVRIKTATSQGS
jgi:hypothetical protein